MQKPKLGTHDVFCINCTDVFAESEATLRHAGRADGRDFYNTECPSCGTYDQMEDCDDRSEAELRERIHEVARQRREHIKAQKRAKEMVTVTCQGCGDDTDVQRQYKHNFERDDGNHSVCDDCREQQNIEKLRECLDPTHDGTFSRADALKRLKEEYDQMPIVDHDGALITSVDVQYGRGIGGEPNGWWVESIRTIEDCTECGYPRAERYTKVNAGNHRREEFSCPKCGHGESYQ